MRALFGLDPDGERARAIDAAGLFERALSFYSSDYVLRVLRAPFTKDNSPLSSGAIHCRTCARGGA